MKEYDVFMLSNRPNKILQREKVTLGNVMCVDNTVISNTKRFSIFRLQIYFR